VRLQFNSTNCVIKVHLIIIINAWSRKVISQQIYIIIKYRKLICPITSQSLLIQLNIWMAYSKAKLKATTVKFLRNTSVSTEIRPWAGRNCVRIWAGAIDFFIHSFQIDSAVQQASRLMANESEPPRFKQMKREADQSPAFGTDINKTWSIHSSRTVNFL
jgi:hypothetical protein